MEPGNTRVRLDDVTAGAFNRYIAIFCMATFNQETIPAICPRDERIAIVAAAIDLMKVEAEVKGSIEIVQAMALIVDAIDRTLGR